MRIAVVGAGAIGGYLGGMLSRAGYDVTLVDQWPEHVEAMKHQGLRITTANGEYRVPVKAIHIHELQKQEPFDLAILSVKSYDTAWACTLIEPYLKPEGFVASAQNSINEERIAQVVGWGRTVGIVVTVGAGLYEPGHVERTDDPERIGYKVGEVHGRVTPRIQRLAEMLSTAAKTLVTTNLWGERWAKLAINCMANPIAGITGLGSAATRQHIDTRRIAIHIAAEVVQVGEALGYPIEPIGSIPPHMMKEAAQGKGLEEVELRLMEDAQRSREGRPSLLQDVLKGRRTEIDHLNGMVARLGAQVGIPTPFNSAIVPIVKEVEAGKRKPSLENIAPLKALLERR